MRQAFPGWRRWRVCLGRNSRKGRHMKGYADLHNLSEDERIDFIGRSVMEGPASSGDKPVMNAFVVDDHAKADRYVQKLKQKFPGIRIIDRFDGPVANA